MNRINCKFCRIEEPTMLDCEDCKAEYTDMIYEQMKDRRDEKVSNQKA